MLMARSFVAALHWRALDRFYDPCLRVVLREPRFRRAVAEHLHLRPGDRVLDVGCGTGTLLVTLAELVPGVALAGIDPDPDILAIAKAKAARSNIAVELMVGHGQTLPDPAGTFDRIVSTLMFHHLRPDEKAATLAEAHRTLKPGGEVLIADLGELHGLLRVLSWPLRHGSGRAADNLAGRVPQLMSQAGFAGVTERDRLRSGFGPVVVHTGTKSGSTAAPKPE